MVASLIFRIKILVCSSSSVPLDDGLKAKGRKRRVPFAALKS
jgi:hypothetical protein